MDCRGGGPRWQTLVVVWTILVVGIVGVVVLVAAFGPAVLGLTK